MRNTLAEIDNRHIALALGLVSVILYWPAIFGQFVWDDRMYLMDNDQIQARSPLNLEEFFRHPTNSFLDFLPFRDWLISLQYQVFGFEPTGYHWVSIALYAAITMLVYRLSLTIYIQCAQSANRMLTDQHARIAAIVATSLFLLHPVHVEGVAWISGQKELLYVLFTLVALLSISWYSESPQNAGYHTTLFLLAYYLSFLCKLTAVGSLVFFPIYWWTIQRTPQQKLAKYVFIWLVINIPVVLWIVYVSGGFASSPGISGPGLTAFEIVTGSARFLVDRLQFLFKLAAVGCLLLVLVYWWKVLRNPRKRSGYVFFWSAIGVGLIVWAAYAGGFVSATASFRGEGRDSLAEIIRATRILGAHAQLVLLPYPLNFGYPFDPSPLLDKHFFIGLSILLVAVTSVVVGPHSITTMGIALFLCYMLPALQLMAKIDNAMIFDRYLFFPLLGVGLIAGYAVHQVIDEWPSIRRAIFGTLTAAGMALAILTIHYIPKFSSDIASLEHAYRHFPAWDRAAFDYVYALLEGNELDKAASVIAQNATFSNPNWVRSYFWGWLLLERGDAHQALPFLQQASRNASAGGFYPFPQIQLARTYIALGNPIVAKRILDYVIEQGNRQPLERIKALRLRSSL